LRANDDACSDAARYDPNTAVTTVYFSACDGSTATSVTVAGYLTTAMDWDGDGRLDLMFGNVGSPIYVSLSTGTGFASPVSTGLAYCNIVVADPNGDGLDDLGCWGSSISYRLHNGAGTKPDLATSFTDGYGVNQTVTYQPATWNYYTKQSGSTSPNKDYAGSMQLVGNVNRTDGIGGTYNESYWYYGGAVDIKGRGFAGFASRKATDSRNGAYTIDYFSRDFPYTGSLTKTEAFQSAGTLISRRQFTLNVNTLDATTYNQRQFTYPTPITTSNYEVGGAANGNLITQAVETRTYDSWGNVTAASTVTTDQDGASPLYGATWTQSTSLTISPNTTYWCLGLPTAVTVANSTTATGSTWDGTSVSRTKNVTPDYINCRISGDDTQPSIGNRRVVTSYGFDGFGNINSVSVTGRDNAGSAMTVRTSYITWGSANGSGGGTGQFPVSETNALGQTTTRTFNSTFGQLATETDPNGIVVTSNTYDLFGRIASQARPDGTSTGYTYAALSGCCNPLGIDYVLTTSYDSGSSPIRYDYVFQDKLGRMINEYHYNNTGSAYWTLSRSYDSLGRISAEGMPFLTSGGGQYTPAYVTTNTYDLLGRLTQQSRPQSQSVSTPQTTTFTYEGRTRTATDPQGKVTTKILDVNGWMRRSQDHNSYYQNFGYDAAGSLTKVNDSLSNALFSASYSYGIQAFQDSISDMDLGARSYYYDSLGELTALSDAKSQTFGFSYDALSRVTSRTEAEGTTNWTWGTTAGSYNIGRLASVSMTGYSESLSYDNKGRLSTQSITTDQAYAIDYAYNTQGLLDTLTYPTSTSSTRVKVKYSYAFGILSSVTDWTSGSAGTVYWTANAQNPRGQTTQETLGNGVVTTRAIDAVTGWTSSIQSGVSGGAALQNQSYLYDLVGNVTQRQESNLGLTENFYYDNLYRLNSSTLNSSTNLSMGYDAMGNITSRSDVNGGATWTYNATKKHAVATTGSGGYSYSYDANGNMSSRNGATIGWASYNYPTSLAAGSESTTFYYDPSRQYYKQIYSGPSGTETTHYVGGLLEKVALSSGTTDWRHYITAEGQTVAIVSRLSTGTNSVSYPLEDHEGSSSVLTDSGGSSIVKESFNAFGLPRNGATWSGSVPSSDKTLINGLTRRGYTVHSMLGDMGLIHMNGRVQDAITGRFLSPDPTVPNPGFTQSFNRYSYVNNNPLSFIDPSGFTGELLDEVIVRSTRLPGEQHFIDWNSLCDWVANFMGGRKCQGAQVGQQSPGGGAGGGLGSTPSGDGKRADSPIESPKQENKPKPKIEQCWNASAGPQISGALMFIGGGGGTSFGFSYGGGLLDSRFFLQVQAYQLAGVGGYIGAGISGQVGLGAVSRGLTTVSGLHVEGDATTELLPFSVNASADFIASASDASLGGVGGYHQKLPGGRVGGGLGAFAGLGGMTQSTIGGYSVREMYNAVATRIGLPVSTPTQCSN